MAESTGKRLGTYMLARADNRHRQSQAALPPRRIDPATEFEPDLAIDPDRLEATGTMQRDAGFVGKGDPGKDRVETVGNETLEQRLIELSTYAAPAILRRFDTRRFI